MAGSPNVTRTSLLDVLDANDDGRVGHKEIKVLDLNRDGSVTKKEALDINQDGHVSSRERTELDSNHDGSVSRHEYAGSCAREPLHTMRADLQSRAGVEVASTRTVVGHRTCV